MVIESGILKVYDGDMKNVVIPDGVRVIVGEMEMEENNAPFQGCSEIETLTMPDSVIIIGTNAFENCCNLRRFCLESCENQYQECF